MDSFVKMPTSVVIAACQAAIASILKTREKRLAELKVRWWRERWQEEMPIKLYAGLQEYTCETLIKMCQWSQDHGSGEVTISKDDFAKFSDFLPAP